MPLRQLSQCERGLVLPEKPFFVAVANVLEFDPHSLRAAQQQLAAVATTGEGYITACSDRSFTIARSVAPSAQKIPILDLFCGTGGFSHGFELTGAFEVSLGVDLLGDRINTFTANHPAVTAWCEDVHDFKSDGIERHRARTTSNYWWAALPGLFFDPTVSHFNRG